MSSESCERCGAAAPAALLRNVSLSVDGSEVDSQTICPDCFADWITHYQEQMAGNMAGAERTGDGALSETVRAASDRADDTASANDQRLQDAVEDGATSATPPGQGGVDDTTAGSAGGQTTTSGGNEIREVGGASGGDDVEVDLSGEAAVAEEEEDDEDDDGLLLG